MYVLHQIHKFLVLNQNLITVPVIFFWHAQNKMLYQIILSQNEEVKFLLHFHFLIEQMPGIDRK